MRVFYRGVYGKKFCPCIVFINFSFSRTNVLGKQHKRKKNIIEKSRKILGREEFAFVQRVHEFKFIRWAIWRGVGSDIFNLNNTVKGSYAFSNSKLKLMFRDCNFIVIWRSKSKVIGGGKYRCFLSLLSLSNVEDLIFKWW